MNKTELRTYLDTKEKEAIKANTEKYKKALKQARDKKLKDHSTELAELQVACESLVKKLDKVKDNFKEASWCLDKYGAKYVLRECMPEYLVANYEDSELVKLKAERKKKETAIKTEYLNVFNNAMMLKPIERIKYLKGLGFDIEDTSCTTLTTIVDTSNLFIK